MSEQPVDDGLRGRFQDLRAATEQPGRVPEFRAVYDLADTKARARPAFGVIDGAPRSHRDIMRMGAWASAALAAAVAGLILVERGPSEDEEFARLVAAYASETAAGAWRSPTSGLLDVPGMELVRSVPSIGAQVPGLDLPAPPEPAPTPSPREDA